MWYELFVLGGFWFWALVAVELIWLFVAVKHERGTWATFSVLTFALMMWLFGNFNVFKYVFQNPIFVLSCFAGYLLLGVGWSFAKWYLFNRAIKETYGRMKEAFLARNHVTGAMPDALKDEWLGYLSDSSHWKSHNDDWTTYVPLTYSRVQHVGDITPKASDYKSDIIFWISYWPISGLWSLLHDFVERMINEIYNYFKSVYDSITTRMFQGVAADFEKNSEA